MQILRRRLILGALTAGGLAGLAACGRRVGVSKFRSYDGPAVTQVVIYKAKRRMFLLHGSEVLKSYKIGLGFSPVGPKRVEGDGKTPEGTYFIDRRNPDSAYYLSLGISYPNAQDIAAAHALGKKPGGDIFIHGESARRHRRGKDWTAGCIAVTDPEMEEIYAMVAPGTTIRIYP